MNGKQMLLVLKAKKKILNYFLPIFGLVPIPNYPIVHLMQKEKGAHNMLIKYLVLVYSIILQEYCLFGYPKFSHLFNFYISIFWQFKMFKLI